MGELIVSLTLIVLGALVLMWLGIWWQNRADYDEPTEHGDGEP